MQCRRVAACLAFIAMIVSSRQVAAQCGAQRSTCSGCHDGSRAPYSASAAWHGDHAFADLCVACHAGNGSAGEPANAHIGVSVAVAAEKCETCHANDERKLTDRYDRGSKSAELARPAVRSVHGSRLPNLLLSVLAAALGAFGCALVLRTERSR
jgi:hypothetical protein